MATKLIRSTDGADLGTWDCGLFAADGSKGRPFGVRTLRLKGRDLIFVAIMDNPQDGKNAKIAVLDSSKLNYDDGADSACEIVQEITWDSDVPATDSGPHLLGVDSKTGALYAALVADSPKSTVLKFKMK